MSKPDSTNWIQRFTNGMPGRVINAGVMLAMSFSFANADDDVRTIQFNRDIRPILSDHCFACHGFDAKARKADMRLDDGSAVGQKLKSGEIAIVPNQPDKSELMARITAHGSDDLMPPAEINKPLDMQQIDMLRRWVAQGAPYEAHWAYRPVTRPDVPAVKHSGAVANDIDRLVLAPLAAMKIAPSPSADRVTLIRRLSFDLIGLPPTAEEVKAFVDDKRPDAYEKLVDHLLASPHYGERMAVHWLDLVRYADTVGYHGDQNMSVWPYRDYVIYAFNENMPFDRFTREQLAGDLMKEATTEQKVASAYNRLNQKTAEGGAQEKEYLAIYQADRVRNVSEVWMGTTMGCAQCHDHKFDPMTMKDFYSMAAFFADINQRGVYGGAYRTGIWGSILRLPTEEQEKKLKEMDAEIAALKNQLAALKEKKAAKPEIEPIEKRLPALEKQRQQFQNSVTLCLVSEPAKPREVRILPRGNWLDESGPVVQPAIPEMFGSLETEGRATRLDLANWLVSADNPLTARVFANRIWAMLLGSGPSNILNDVGSQGEAPTNPELLDYLAGEFVRSGWDVKHLVKMIVMSKTYRQSSQPRSALVDIDPYNRLYARQSRFRLDAEFVRDNALKTSGLLVTKIGGESARPYQPPKYYAQLNFPRRQYKASTDENQYRRGVYTHWQRTFLHPTLKAFDAPSREECTAKRSRSNTPLAALTLLNDPTFVEASRALAVRIIQEGGDDVASRIDWAHRQVLSRPADREVAAILKKVFDDEHGQYKTDPEAAKKLSAIGMYKAPETIDAAELAAWTSVARVLFNLHSTITRY